MSTLYITEFTGTGSDAIPISIPVARLPALVEQKVVIGAGSVQSAALNANTTFVRVSSDSVCSIATGSNPTATAASMRLAADSPEYFGVIPGTALKIAVITNT